MKRSRNWYKAGYGRICLAELLSSPQDSEPPEDGRGSTSSWRISRMPYFVATQSVRRPQHPQFHGITVACDSGTRCRKASAHDTTRTRRNLTLWRSSIERLSSKDKLAYGILYGLRSRRCRGRDCAQNYRLPGTPSSWSFSSTDASKLA